MGWPSDNNESVVLIGVLIISLLPMLLAFLDVIIARGGVIEFKGVKIDFYQVRYTGMSGVTIPVNIGVRGEPVTDSSTVQILDALKQAVTCNAIILDLEEGDAWWETRLLVLLAGAERLGKPGKIVFVGNDAGREQCFLGWAHPNDLLRLLVKAHPQYMRSLQAAKAAARQWELVEPLNPADPANPGTVPPQPHWIQVGLAAQHPWMAFDQTTGLFNELLAEQLLAADLGAKVESQGEPKKISIGRLEELFRPVLNKDRIEQSWPYDRQINAFFNTETDYIAYTRDGRFVSLVPKYEAATQMLKMILDDDNASQ